MRLNHLAYALAYASMGWAVFPVHSITVEGRCTCSNRRCEHVAKHPMTPKGFHDATLDRESIEEWWKKWPQANIGIATGAKSGIVVLDIDDDSFLEEVPETVECFTGGGGRHLYFKCPTWHVKNTANVLPGLDSRGDGGYVVAPPSLHESGKRYEWEVLHSPSQCELADMPIWWAERLKEKVDQISYVNKVEDKGVVWEEYVEGSKIGKGTRDQTLFTIGCSMRAHGAAYNDILATLTVINEKRCYPPMNSFEVSQKARQAAKYTPGKTGGLLDFPPTDSGNAERLIHRYRQDIRYCDAYGCWFVWDSRRWIKDDNGFLYRLALETVRAYRQEAQQLLTDIKNQDEETAQKEKSIQAIIKFANQSEFRSRIEAMIELANKIENVAVRPHQLDTHPYLINFNNGTYDLKKKALLPHRREDLITKLAPLDFDISAKCPTWFSFLNRAMAGNEEMINFLKRSAGLILSGDTSEEQLWIVYGVGANGKSKFINTLQEILGNYSQQAPTSLFMAKRNTGGATPELARIKGARFVTCIETSDGKRLDEEMVKQLTGRDLVTARQLYKDYFEFRPECKMWLVTNHKPIIQGTDHGIWRRIYLIPFEVVIPEEEQDKRLPDKLKTELSGILNWCIEGFHEWAEIGMKPPAKIRESTKEYQSEMDKMGSYIDDCCELDKQEKTPLDLLYTSYLDWCRVNEEFSNNKRAFARQLKERGLISKRSTGGSIVFLGIKLKSDRNEQSESFSRNFSNKKHFSIGESYKKTITSVPSVTNSAKVISNTNKIIALEDEWDEGTL